MMDKKTKELLDSTVQYENREVTGQAVGLACDAVCELRAALDEHASLLANAEKRIADVQERFELLQLERDNLAQVFDEFAKQREAERRTWASLVSTWYLFHEEPDHWLPYVESALKALEYHGVSSSIINSLTPFPDAAERINKENAIAQQLAKNALQQRMSDISEACWCTSWLIGTEFSLWQFVINGPGEWGQESVGQADIDELKMLSHMCKGWFVWGDNDSDVKFVPMREWIDVFMEWEARNGQGTS